MQEINKSFPFLVLLILLVIVLNSVNVSAKKSEVLQFTAKGHVLGFEKTGLYVATGSHALKISFAGTEGVVPDAITDASGSKKAMPLKKVKYSELWEGITLTYTHTDKDIFESTYLYRT